ncbi:MAG: DUF4956 domain-containing protein [Clostridia bacterium]|nr:DUF4956 domain-containing protein [Clostridia bacterium]
MKENLFSILEKGSQLSTEQMIMQIVMSLVLGLAIFISYKLSHTGTIYSKKFNSSLVILSVLTGTVMTVIGNNLALSLGMVGALSIVRFRTAIKDSRDTVYIFWAIIVGICCGVGDYTVALIGSIVVFVITILLGRVKNDNRILLIIRADKSIDRKIESIVFSYFNRKAILKVKNTTENSTELIYELSSKVYNSVNKREKDITELLYELGAVEYVNIVTQSDEISG